jgi:predicted TIM-barrel fold metal-dependent hydrolase
MRIDCQSHVFPPAYAELLLQSRSSLRAEKDGDVYRISYGELQEYRLRLEMFDPAAKLREMDAHGIDVAVLSVNTPGPELLPVDLGAAAARACNEFLATLCAKHPARFVALAMLPLQDMEAAMAEYERAIGDLGLRGVMLFSNIRGCPIDAPIFEPLYARAARDRIPLVLHPAVPGWGAAVADYSMIPMIGIMMDSTIAMLRLILGGTLERHPDLLVVHPHCGGALPYLMPRVEEQTEVKRRGREHIRRPPGEYYREVYLDLVSPSAQAMQYAYDFARPDRLLFGSDHPWVKIGTLLACFDRTAIPAPERARILGENARRLFRLA